jgi:hypothetical protein
VLKKEKRGSNPNDFINAGLPLQELALNSTSSSLQEERMPKLKIM